MILHDWILLDGEKTYSASVPGDIVADVCRESNTGDPYFGLNHNDLDWICRKNYTYVTEFDFGEKINSGEEVVLKFGGIDLFSEIYLNGKFLGKTENMFLEYVYDVSDVIREKGNKLEVKMISTLNVMDSLDCKDYFGVFNTPRVLIRKEQCCFGWDWAPNVPGYGIWKSVELEKRSKNRITELYYETDTEGNATFHISLNYYKRSGYDKDGNFIEVKEKFDGDELVVTLAVDPDGKKTEVKRFKVCGNKCFINFHNENAKLWWPIGYGEHPLYPYKVELFRNGVKLSESSGKLAYRTVSLKQKPTSDVTCGFEFYINDKPIFVKGSNWVPIDCFTGTIESKKYEKLIRQAVRANVNMLRVWGGGIYEDDLFYDLCDELGVMVWQDFMFACGDIPDDNETWVKNASAECVYQVKRLRNHPSLIYWCGGNEKTGSFGTMITYGDYFVDVILRGLVLNYDTTRPYGRQSPCAMTDMGNDKSSGESHHNSFEASLDLGMSSYRNTVAKEVVPFISECAIMGPHSRQCFERIFPKEKLWPMNEYWNDRLMENPYAANKMGFAERQKVCAEALYGKAETLDDFIKKAMMVHEEALRCESEFARAHKGKTSGILNWMYSEVWPTGTWSIVDYYTEPKQVYYGMAKFYAPVLMSFFEDADGRTHLFGVNDTLEEKDVEFTYGVRDLSGKTLFVEGGKATLSTTGVFEQVVNFDVKTPNSYAFVEYTVCGERKKTLYSSDLWSSCKFVSDFEVKKERLAKNKVKITVKANEFAKSVFINAKDNYKVEYTDNYFDLEKGEEKTVIATSEEELDLENMEITTYANE